MTAFQLQAFVPADGTLSITLPEHFREPDVRLYVSKEKTDESPQMNEERHMDNTVLMSDEEYKKYMEEMLADTPMMSEEERLALLYPFGEAFHRTDYSSISDEEYIEGIRSLRGILTGPVDYSDLREETDREL
jgi:hypothetical protein